MSHYERITIEINHRMGYEDDWNKTMLVISGFDIPPQLLSKTLKQRFIISSNRDIKHRASDARIESWIAMTREQKRPINTLHFMEEGNEYRGSTMIMKYEALKPYHETIKIHLEIDTPEACQKENKIMVQGRMITPRVVRLALAQELESFEPYESHITFQELDEWLKKGIKSKVCEEDINLIKVADRDTSNRTLTWKISYNKTEIKAANAHLFQVPSHRHQTKITQEETLEKYKGIFTDDIIKGENYREIHDDEEIARGQHGAIAYQEIIDTKGNTVYMVSVEDKDDGTYVTLWYDEETWAVVNTTKSELVKSKNKRKIIDDIRGPDKQDFPDSDETIIEYADIELSCPRWGMSW